MAIEGEWSRSTQSSAELMLWKIAGLDAPQLSVAYARVEDLRGWKRRPSIGAESMISLRTAIRPL
jgi:hypothetical protein